MSTDQTAAEPEAIVDGVQAIYDAQLARVGQAVSAVGDFTRRRPWAALGLACGFGVVVGRRRSGRSGTG